MLGSTFSSLGPDQSDGPASVSIEPAATTSGWLRNNNSHPDATASRTGPIVILSEARDLVFRPRSLGSRARLRLTCPPTKPGRRRPASRAVSGSVGYRTVGYRNQQHRRASPPHRYGRTAPWGPDRAGSAA